MVSCNDLLSLNIFKDIKLIAGKKGIYKRVSWPYICQTLNFSEWVNGGELMFLTGMNLELNDEILVKLIYECVEKDISGLVILTNSEYIKSISQRIIDTCNEVGLPLFDMPWKIKLIDVNKEIANYIMELSSKKNKEKELVFELLFSSKQDNEKAKNLATQGKFDIDKKYFVAVFILNERYENRYKEKYIEIEKSNSGCKKDKANFEQILNNIRSMLSKSNIDAIVDIYDNHVICIIDVDSGKDYQNKKDTLTRINEKEYSYFYSKLIIGSVYKDIYSIRYSYNECIKVNKLYKVNNWEFKYIDYKKLGFYKILFEVENSSKLEKYCYEVLGTIIEHDKNSQLLKTLRSYLKNNCNLINTSKELFIHRNTLIYRLNKIKYLLDDNLDDQISKNDIINALMIYDYLKCLK